MTSHDILISEKLKFDSLKNKNSFWSEIKKTFFLFSQVLSVRHDIQNKLSKNVAITSYNKAGLFQQTN